MKNKPPNISRSKTHLSRLNMPEVRLEKLSKAAWKLCSQTFSDAAENSWMAAVEHFSEPLQLAELDNFHNEKKRLLFHWRFNFESFCLFVGFAVNVW